MPVIYQGKRTRDGVTVTYKRNGGKALPLRLIAYHSDEYEWGYPGSGPATLSLSILAHHLGETWVNGPYLRNFRITSVLNEPPLCWKFHQDFKRDIITGLDRDTWELSSEQVHNWLMSHMTIEEGTIERTRKDDTITA